MNSRGNCWEVELNFAQGFAVREFPPGREEIGSTYEHLSRGLRSRENKMADPPPKATHSRFFPVTLATPWQEFSLTLYDQKLCTWYFPFTRIARLSLGGEPKFLLIVPCLLEKKVIYARNNYRKLWFPTQTQTGLPLSWFQVVSRHPSLLSESTRFESLLIRDKKSFGH